MSSVNRRIATGVIVFVLAAVLLEPLAIAFPLPASAEPFDQQGENVGLAGEDTFPPAAVCLNIGVKAESVMLMWTAPGDDGNEGTASEYDIRYSTSPITEDNWDSATQCIGEPVPQPAGSIESFVVTGLAAGTTTTYYFALKPADEVPNWSALSNVPFYINSVARDWNGCTTVFEVTNLSPEQPVFVTMDFYDLDGDEIIFYAEWVSESRIIDLSLYGELGVFCGQVKIEAHTQVDFPGHEHLTHPIQVEIVQGCSCPGSAPTPKTMYVPDDYPTIQAAVDAASPGDTIIVRDGTYIENVEINKSLVVKSENGADSTIVQQVEDVGGVFTITGDSVELSGFTIKNGISFGIQLCSSNNVISDNNINSNIWGVYVYESSQANNIQDNHISHNSHAGIDVRSSNNNTIVNNEILFNGAEEGGIGIYVNGWFNEIRENNISNNASGIILGGHFKSGNIISNNNISSNNLNGIHLSFARENTITENNVNSNGQYGISLWCSGGSNVFLNNFENEDNHYYGTYVGCGTPPPNIWNSSEEMTYAYNEDTLINYLGNYWGDYQGDDEDSDGIGDTAYFTGSPDRDDYPLMEPFENYEIGPGPPVLSVNPSSLHFGATQTQKSFDISNEGGGTLTWSVSEDKTWLSVSPTSGTGDATITVNVDRSGQSPGDYTADISVSSNGGNETVQVTMEVEAPPENRPPTAYASDISDQPQTMYPDTIYSVTTEYYDLDGSDDLKYCYLQLRHPSKRLTMMWYQSDGSWSPWAGEEGANYLTITGVTSTELANGYEGYELTWSFKINDNWPQAENSIDFGVSACDDDDLESGWDYDNTKASFIVNQPPNQPTALSQFKADGATVIPVGSTTNESTVVFKGVVSDPDGDQVKLQIELRRLDEYGGEFDETKGGLKDSNFVESGSEAVAYAHELINGDYHWRARSIDEHGEASEWVDFGDNDTSDADFVVDTVTVDRPPVLLAHGFQLTDGFYPVDGWKNVGEILTGIEKEEQVANTVPGHSFWKLEKRSEDGFTVYISNYTLDTSIPSYADIRLYALNLADEIEAIREEEGVDEVDIVAHSMGGLVARAYIESEDLEILEDSYRYETLDYNNDVGKLIMLGSPNHGVSLAILGILLSNTSCLFSLTVPLNEFIECLEENNYFAFAQMAPVPPVSSEPYSAFLIALNLGETGKQKGVEYSTIAGNVYEHRTYGIYKGDGWVSVKSVTLDEVPSDRSFECALNHTELRTTALAAVTVKNILLESTKPIDIRYPYPEMHHYACPVNIAITDQYGRTIDDQGTNEIPGADVEVIGGEKIFYLPPDLTYQVDIDAYDTGDFTLMEASPVTTDVRLRLINRFDGIPVISETKATLEIAPDEMDRIMEIDYDGDGVIDEEKSPDASEMIGDATPPSAVTDLAASDPTCNSMTLTWTAPGDDGNTGIANGYDIRYSTSPITEDNWDLATQCAAEPAPQPAGGRETFAVTGLSPGTTYYFALKTADELPNSSGLSNVPSGATRTLTPRHKVYLPLILKNYP